MLEVLPKWCNTEESIMSRWLETCESRDRYSKVFKQLNLSDRLKRLLAVAYCYDIWSLLKDERSKNAVIVAEKYADGVATEQEQQTARSDAYAAADVAAYAAAYDAADAAAYAAADAAADDAAADAADDAAYAAARKYKWVYHGKLLVSIIGPSWEFSSEWKTTTAITLAAQMYESRDFSAMPILADAIQDAGCNEENLLAHMRNSESAWCRGCRIVDELLGKR